MASSKKQAEPISTEVQLPGGSSEIDFGTMGSQDLGVGYDQEKVDEIQGAIDAKKEEIRNKVYAVSCNQELFNQYENFMQEKAEWNSTEALGVVEVNRQLQKIKKEGIKDNVIYMGALPLEASHYFLSKSKGSGLKSAEDFLRLFKAFDQALSDAKEDAATVKEMEKQLAAAMQGISLG
jgi:hypothetical protein